MTKATGLKDELRAFKRERIIAEMMALFTERGYHGATLDLLAARLQVTKPFVYQFFRSKEDLLATVYERGARHLVEAIDAALRADLGPAALLHRFVYDFARQNAHSHAVGVVFLQEERNLPPDRLRTIRAVQEAFDAKLAALIEKGIADGTFRVANARLAAAAIIGMVRWIQQWYGRGEAVDAHDLAVGFADYALRLVGTREGAEPGPPAPPDRRVEGAPFG